MSKIQKPKYKRTYYNNKPSNKRISLDVNQRGFLCSCNNREKDCVRESYNILNKYADALWPQSNSGGSEVQVSDDVEDELQKELSNLKSENKEGKKFQVVDSGAKNFLFIKTTLDEPVKLAETILTDVYEKKSQETRFLLRLIPIETTCRAYIKDIEKAFEELCEKHFANEAKTFSVVFNHRNNNNVVRDEVIKSLADAVAKKGEEKGLTHKVDLKNAEVSIVVEIIRGFAFLGVVPHFLKFKKYNLLAFAEEPQTDGQNNVSQLEECEKSTE